MIHAWKQRKLGDVFKEYSEKNHAEQPALTIMQGEGTIKREDSERNLLYNKSNLSSYKMVYQDDFIVHLRSFEGGLEKASCNGIVSPAYHIFHGEKADSRFYYSYFRSYEFIKRKLVPHIYGIRDGRSIDIAGMKTIDIPYPSFEEQRRIGDYLDSVNNLISFHHRKSNLFNKTCRNAWEQRKFDDLADYKKGPFGSALKKDMFVPKSDMTVKVYEQQNAINKDWHLERYFITEEYANKLSGFRVEGGDIIVSCAGTIGETYEIPLDAEPGIINQALMRIKVKESIVNKKMFNILFTNMINDFTRVHSNGSAIKNIPPFSDLKPMVVFVPKMDEQNKISSYFSNLDHLITLHQQKCKQLQIIRKFMLKNMFL